LEQVSLALDAGQFGAIRGESGCGKTTLLLAIGGLLRPDAGSVLLAGEDPYCLPPEGRARFRARNIGYVFQQFHLVPYLTVRDNVLAPALAGGVTDPRRRAEELIGLLRLEDRADHVPAMLSTGERQRTAIARAMLARPKLILADEPTGNLDDANAEIVLGYLSQFAAEGGAVLLVTHDERAAAHAQHHWRMSRGRLVPQ
jgi:ABC-type lipoprotein export system ATPase subunit